MNCEKCQELLSDFLEGTLTGDERALLNAHFGECFSCIGVREELASIISAAQECREFFIAPPNERALWLRISNTIEVELNANQRGTRALSNGVHESFLSRLMNKRWALSLPQLSAAVLAIIVGVSVATVFGVQSLWNHQMRASNVSSVSLPPTQTGVAKRANPDQQLAIEYLMQRVEERKSRWNPRMRETFDRNMNVIDAAVNESLQQLNESPHDEISEQALDAAMRDKMELLREFSEL